VEHVTGDSWIGDCESRIVIAREWVSGVMRGHTFGWQSSKSTAENGAS